MGCDVHASVIAETYGGFQETIFENVSMPRDYELFGLLAGVRDSNVTPISDPKGWESLPHNYLNPNDTYWGDHTPSWLTFKELKKLPKRYKSSLWYKLVALVAKKHGDSKTIFVFNFDS